MVIAMDGAQTRARRLSASLMSPFCPGMTLETCTSPRAAVWRTEIREWAAEGATDREIVERLGQRVPGFDLSGRPGATWDWALPVGVMAAASAVLWIVARRARLRTEDAAPPEPTANPEADARLKAELAAFDPQ
jgi:cytochrome c-type biogenesis protein CcmH/NrfF